MSLLFSSIFGELTKQVQVRIDAASELRKRLFDQNIYERYLDWDTPTIGLNFEELIGSYNLSVAAATLESNGKEPIMGTEGLETLKQKVLNHSISFSMTIEEYRKVLQILDSRMIGDAQKAQMLINLMWKNVNGAVNSVQSKLDIIFLGALSNEGVFTFDATNNPEGGVKGTIDYKMPSENKATVTTSWTDANKDTVDCFEDLQGILDAAQDKVSFEKILLSQSKLSYILRNKKMKLVVFGQDKSSTPLLLSNLNEFMQQNNFPVFETIRRTTRIQNNGKLTNYTPWNADNMVFVPSGKLGLIKNAYADNELRQEPGVTYSNYGRIRISQWGKGETDNSNGVEFTKAQSLSLPVITEINGIYSLKTIK
ncbi:major capsid protein [uncultured Bacteroides sp.]|uniref:major capsid protein n=1 Tax=uncultured Bacteroides sp. TaxID=162156 RepID=UPI002AAB7A31|nr:major capsid protein [uncultured Bacteroides sp.]